MMTLNEEYKEAADLLRETGIDDPNYVFRLQNVLHFLLQKYDELQDAHISLQKKHIVLLKRDSINQRRQQP